MTRMSWPVAVVALGFLALIGVMFWKASSDMNNFASLWAAAGPIVGVVIGAIPGAAFGATAQQQQRRTQHRAEVYARQMPPERAAIAADEIAEAEKANVA
ncbi:hypothetical protein PHK61_31315 [Actinomycetospora lutea]|uniref:hypothetical protein n=1 Tax=Actinomycetospora lutea TaxID=663604 RepID=UPI002365E485|nr:hypothetical protein [Actinomycetospora lutea]MDD7942909.1 hypothetical protein [Actinomycetospora lutea]